MVNSKAARFIAFPLKFKGTLKKIPVKIIAENPNKHKPDFVLSYAPLELRREMIIYLGR
jgi:hypothetical protein